MAPKRYACHTLLVACYCNKLNKRKKDTVDGVVSIELHSVSAVHQQHKDLVVRIVLAGGMVELYSAAIPAHMVMEKHPGLCLARPEVFKKPHESLVDPTERLLPGQKFYLVPWSTVTKLRTKNPCRSGDEGVKETAVLDKVEKGGEDDEVSEECVLSARDFYVSKEKWSECFVKRFGKRDEQQMQKPSTPQVKRGRSRQGLLGGWKPSLTSVKELSP